MAVKKKQNVARLKTKKQRMCMFEAPDNFLQNRHILSTSTDLFYF